MSDEPIGDIDEVIASLVELGNVFACGQDVFGDQLFLACGQWCHDGLRLT
jgi:hypothetical protein